MGFGYFLLLCLVTVGLAYLAVLAAGYFFPGHPILIDRIIWGVAILIIVVTLLRALGLMGHDPKIPTLTLSHSTWDAVAARL